jgi:hypothetical protein
MSILIEIYKYIYTEYTNWIWYVKIGFNFLTNSLIYFRKNFFTYCHLDISWIRIKSKKKKILYGQYLILLFGIFVIFIFKKNILIKFFVIFDNLWILNVLLWHLRDWIRLYK